MLFKGLFGRAVGAALLACFCLTMIAGTSTLSFAAAPAQGTLPTSISKPQRVNMYFIDRDQPATWESLGFDLPEATVASDIAGFLGYVPNVDVTPDQYAAARARGITMRIVGDVPSEQPDWGTCYRNYDEMVAYLNSVVTRFPNLADLSDIGDSFDKLYPHNGYPPHDIWRIHLTNHSTSGPKPKFHLVAAHHAREIATPELALQWIEELVTGYGTNADITWLLDNREVYIVPVENPDGWWHASTDQVYWRKNDDNTSPGACGYPSNGVDPNRNYPVCWSCPGASSNPCDATYYGPGAGSEPETQNMMNEYTTVHPDAMISLHTYGPYVLYPWGNSGLGTPPDRAGLDAFAWNMARINNNTPRSEVGQPYNVLYNVSGTTDDWTYQQWRIPSFTIELGGYNDFNMPCSVLPTVVNQYKPVLTYALKATSAVTQTTYMHAFGPTPNNVSASLTGTTLNISAVISANYGTTNGAIYSIDTLPEDGNGTAMTLTGQNATASADVSGLPNGRHTLFVQGRAAYTFNGNTSQWGVVSAVFFTTGPALTTTPTSTGQPSSTATNTATSTATGTNSPTVTPTRTSCVTVSPPTNTATYTPSHTPTIATRTGTATFTSTAVSTSTSTSTQIATSTSTPPNVTSTPATTGTPCSITFSDVHPTDYFYEPVRYLFCLGAISGYGDNTFRPYANTTRGQLSKIVTLAEGWTISTPTGTPTFRDVAAGSPFYAYVETAYSHNVISGYSCGTGCLEFRPNNNVTRAQLTKIIVLAQNWEVTPPTTPTFRDVPTTDAFYGYVETAYAHNIISGYSCGGTCLEFRPGANATRGQIAKIVYNAVTNPHR